MSRYCNARLKDSASLRPREQVKPAGAWRRWRPTCSSIAAFHSADAEIGAEVALWAQLHGSDSHGIVHLPLYVRGLLDRTIKAQPAFAITQANARCAVLDADHGLGLVASRRAIDLAIDIAKQLWAWRGCGAQQQPFRRCRLLCRSCRRARPDRPCFHECHAGDRADRGQRRIAWHQSHRCCLSDTRRRPGHRRHGDRGGSALAHTSCAGGRTKKHSGRLGARSEPAGRRPIRLWP